MSDLFGLCTVCGKSDAMFSCRLCGRLVCSRCFDSQHGVCCRCQAGKNLSHL